MIPSTSATVRIVISKLRGGTFVRTCTIPAGAVPGRAFGNSRCSDPACVREALCGVVIVPLLALATVAVAGCDMSQKPRTIGVEVRPAVSAPFAPGDQLGPGAVPAANAASEQEVRGERSMRL